MRDRLRALVVDDEEVIRNMLQFVLEQEGFEADHAENGEVALDKYSRHHYDLIVTDLSMPRFNGHILVLKILADLHHPVVVVHTSFNEPRLTKYMLDRGVDDVVLKPANYEFLAAKLKSLVLRHNPESSECLTMEHESVPVMNNRPAVEEVPSPLARRPSEQTVSATTFLPLVCPVALSVYRLSQNAEATVDEIVDEILQDAHLTSELLRLGNQPERRGNRELCKDITQLLCRFGTRRTGELALVASVNLYSF